jgi:hypothetical protein
MEIPKCIRMQSGAGAWTHTAVARHKNLWHREETMASFAKEGGVCRVRRPASHPYCDLSCCL